MPVLKWPWGPDPRLAVKMTQFLFKSQPSRLGTKGEEGVGGVHLTGPKTYNLLP